MKIALLVAFRGDWLLEKMKRVLIAGSDRFKAEKQEAIAEFDKLNYKTDESCRIYHDNHQEDLYVCDFLQQCKYLYIVCGTSKSESYIGDITTLLMGFAKGLRIPCYVSCKPPDPDYKHFYDNIIAIADILTTFCG